MFALGQDRPSQSGRDSRRCPLRSDSDPITASHQSAASCHKRTHAPRLKLRPLTLQLFDSSALSPFSSSHAVDRFEAHFEKSVLLFAPVSALMRRQGLAV